MIKQIFSFYECRGEYCNAKYAIEAETVEEPICPACGCYYFIHLTDIEIEINQVNEVDADEKVQVEQTWIA